MSLCSEEKNLTGQAADTSDPSGRGVVYQAVLIVSYSAIPEHSKQKNSKAIKSHGGFR